MKQNVSTPVLVVAIVAALAVAVFVGSRMLVEHPAGPDAKTGKRFLQDPKNQDKLNKDWEAMWGKKAGATKP